MKSKKKSKKKITKKETPFVYKPEREEKLVIEATTIKKTRKSNEQLFWDIKEGTKIKDIAKLTGKSVRTIQSYYKYLSGQSMGKSDRKPPKEFLKKLASKASKIKLNPKHVDSVIKKGQRVKKIKTTVLTLTRSHESLKLDSFISRDKRKLLAQTIKELGKNYSYTLVRIAIKVYKKHGETFHDFLAIHSSSQNANEIFEKVQDFFKSFAFKAYVIKVEILNMNFRIMGRIIKEDKNGK